MDITYSRASCYQRCPYLHYFNYVERIEPKSPVKALRFGSDFHLLLENRGDKANLKQAMKSIREAYDNLPESYQETLGEDYITNLKTIFKDYRQHWKDRPLPIDTELEFEATIGKYKGQTVTFKGKIDELYQEGKDIVIGEHKTFSYKPNMDILAMNMQICLYAKAVELIYGKLPIAVIWDYIKSTPASEPLWLEKSKRFSNAASQQITPYSYMRALDRKGIDYPSSDLTQYEPNISNFFFKCRLDFVPEMIESIWTDFKDLAKEIVVKGDNNKRKVVSRDCSWCSYRAICYGEFTGADVDYIKEKDFQPRKKDEFEVLTD